MKKHLFEIAKHSAIYTVGNFLTRAMGILLIPLYTRYLTTSDYGIVSNVVAIINFFSILFIFGMDAVWGRFYFDFKDRSEEQKRFLGNIVLFLIIFGIGLIFLILLWGKSFFKLILPDLDFWPYILLGILTAYTGVFFRLKRMIFRVRQQSVQFGVLSFGRFLLSLILIIIGVVILKKGALGKVTGEFIAWSIFAIICIILIKKDIIFNFNWQAFKPALKYGISVLPHSFSGVLVNVFDRVIMTNYKGLGETGIYTIGFQVGSIMSLLVFSINLSWSPFFMKTMKAGVESGVKIVSRLTSYIVLIISFIGVALTYFSYEIIKIVATPSYYRAVDIVPIYVFSFVLYGMYFLFSVKIFYVKKAVKYLFLASVSAAIINLIFNLVLIPRLGMLGAAWARFISNLTLVLITFLISQKFLPIKYDYKFFTIVLSMTILSVLAYEFFIIPSELSVLSSIVFKMIVLISFLVFPFTINLLKYSELKKVIKDLLQRGK